METGLQTAYKKSNLFIGATFAVVICIILIGAIFG